MVIKQNSGAITEVITLSKGAKSNIDMGLVLANNFDLELTNKVNKVTIKNHNKTKEYLFDNQKIAKIDLAPKDISSSIATIEYTITVKNKGDVEGYARKIVDYIPEDLTFNKDLNPDWYIGSDGNLYTKALANEAIAKGQSKEVKLILTKQMTEDNTGLINNTAEIAEYYNENGLEDINSKPQNKVENENDFQNANVIISVRTGGVFIFTSITFTTILLGGITVFVIISKLKNIKRKEGGV